jgi:selenocysteine lyase/cysteine desulfurase
MTFDIQRARQDTPGCSNVLHFNNAGASLMPQPVLDATIGHLQLETQKEIQQQLASQHINVSVSTRSSTHLDMEARGLTSMVRASIHYYNTEEEISQFTGSIEKVLAR